MLYVLTPECRHHIRHFVLIKMFKIRAKLIDVHRSLSLALHQQEQLPSPYRYKFSSVVRNHFSTRLTTYQKRFCLEYHLLL
jgi:hypothetical protein